jgi:hypothetical protein
MIEGNSVLMPRNQVHPARTRTQRRLPEEARATGRDAFFHNQLYRPTLVSFFFPPLSLLLVTSID